MRNKRNLDAFAQVDNVLNTAYEELARYRMPGRNWMFGAAIRF